MHMMHCCVMKRTAQAPIQDESDIESDNERETEKVCDKVTEEDDFSGFSAQEEDEDSDQ